MRSLCTTAFLALLVGMAAAQEGSIEPGQTVKAGQALVGHSVTRLPRNTPSTAIQPGDRNTLNFSNGSAHPQFTAPAAIAVSPAVQ